MKITKGRNKVLALHKNERLKIFRKNLIKLATQGKEDRFCFVIFEVMSEKFVQFADIKDKDARFLTCDIPLQELSEEEEKRLQCLELFEKTPNYLESGEIASYSYVADFDYEEIEEAANIAERVFIQVFHMPPNYEINVELNLED